MNIQPYVSVDSLLFGESTAEDCEALYGRPQRITENRYAAAEYHYDGFVVRFDAERKTLAECTLLPFTEATVAGVAVTWDKSFLRKVCTLDSEPVDVCGFIVMKDMGIAVTGIHDGDQSQLAITAFATGALDDVMDEARPFDARELR